MGNFRSDNRRGFGGRDRGSSRGFNGRSGGRSFGGDRGGFRSRDRDSGFDRERKPLVDVVCDKCGKNCQVPFKPTGDKPVYCSECFSKGGSSRRRDNFSSSSSSGISQEQYNELNAKLDKILGILENIEFEEEEEESSDEEDEDEEEVK